MEAGNTRSWLCHPVTESNLQLFGLISVWISSKMHDFLPLSVRCLKSLANNIIRDQHFATRDFLEAVSAPTQKKKKKSPVKLLTMNDLHFWRLIIDIDICRRYSSCRYKLTALPGIWLSIGWLIYLVLPKVLNFEIGTTNIAFLYLEELWMQIKRVAIVGDLINFETCMEIMDLLYEKEETSILYKSPCSLAASILVASYLITVPKQKWEFPLLPWVKFVTSYREEEIIKIVRDILKHVLDPSSDLQG